MTAEAIPTGDARGWSGRSSNFPSSSRNYACAASLSDGSELCRHPAEPVRHKTRRRMCPLYVTGLIGAGDRKSVQPMAERLALGDCDIAD